MIHMFNIKKYTIMLCIVLTGLNVPIMLVSSQITEEMHVHFIDVGQGDSILIETPSEKSILIDGGPPEAGQKVIAYLNEKDIDQLDLLIVTHPDIDHIGGLLDVMQNISIKK